MLGQYVKVLLGEYRLELYDVGEQQSGSSKCLLTVSGFLCETLGGHSCGSEVNLSKFWEDTCKKQLVSEPPVRAMRLRRRFFELVTNFIRPYLHQFSIDSHGLNGYGKPLKRPFDRYQSRLEAINNGRDIRQINW